VVHQRVGVAFLDVLGNNLSIVMPHADANPSGRVISMSIIDGGYKVMLT